MINLQTSELLGFFQKNKNKKTVKISDCVREVVFFVL